MNFSKSLMRIVRHFKNFVASSFFRSLFQEYSQPNIEEDSFSVQYDSDEFSLEYEVESSDHRSESDISSRESGKVSYRKMFFLQGCGQ